MGSCRGAAEVRGTTHEIVKRKVLAEGAEIAAGIGPVAQNYDGVRDVVAERVATT